MTKNQVIDVFGTSLRINNLKEHGYLRVARFSGKSSLLRDELPVIVNLALLLSPGDSFIDIGANVGIYCCTLARFQRFSPTSRVYAFEANPDTFGRLVVSAEAMGVQAYNLALSDHSGTLEFFSGAVSHVFTTSEHTSAYNILKDPQLIPCRRLDEFDLTGDSFVLKIDVEGQELEVLRGAIRLFEAERIKAVYIDGYKDKRVEEFLREFGFRLYEGRTLQPVSGNVFSLLAIRS